MRRYPGNHTDSELLTVPRFLKTRAGAPQTHLAYITDSEADLLKENKPGTPHGGPHGIPNYDSYEYQTAREEQQAYARETGQSRQEAARSLGTQDHGGPRNVQEQQQERAFDRQTQIQTNIRDEQQRKAQQKRDVINNQKMQRAQKADKLGKALMALGINRDQFDRYRNAGILPENIARELGLVKEGEHWDPRGKFTEEMKLGLEEQQFAYDEGVYGGVAGIEAEINKIKKQAITGNKDEREAAYEQLDALFARQGKSPQETQKAVDQMLGQFGYDKTGMYTWSDIESDQSPGGLYSKYLNRGNLWDDPLSGILAPQKQINYGSGTGGGWGSGWGGGYGGGGGGYGFSMQQDPMQQGYQRGRVGPGTLQEQVNQIYLGMSNLNPAPGFQKKRGGIISLLGLN